METFLKIFVLVSGNISKNLGETWCILTRIISLLRAWLLVLYMYLFLKMMLIITCITPCKKFVKLVFY